MIVGRRIVLGVSGGIAAYKAIEVCRRLVDAGAHVVPVMTRGATRFVGETTFSALASEPVHTSLFTDRDPIPHTRLGQSADLVVVVPATARVIGTYAAGISSDLLTATLLATEAPVVVCPAMHTEMWRHPAVQENIATLARRGVHIVPPEEGRLAGGDVGAGRLAAPEVVVAAIEGVLSSARDMAGLHVLVTAGGTREPIDPVRFIGNRSSGKQGHALAAEAATRGAKVTLVTTVGLPVPPGADVVRVETAAEMADAVGAVAPAADVVVMAAAVADYRPASPSDAKRPKDGAAWQVELQPTTDVLAAIGGARRRGQVIVGFAADEGGAGLERAREKRRAKQADLFVFNDVSRADIGFDADENEVVIVSANGDRRVAKAPKRAVAAAILDEVERLLSSS
jgi:phosphopantothenoylcysteine decarboxylase / phosphopantothenate---cysteine ligase